MPDEGQKDQGQPQPNPPDKKVSAPIRSFGPVLGKSWFRVHAGPFSWKETGPSSYSERGLRLLDTHVIFVAIGTKDTSKAMGSSPCAVGASDLKAGILAQCRVSDRARLDMGTITCSTSGCAGILPWNRSIPSSALSSHC